MTVASGVMMSVFVSPVIAAVTVGKFVVFPDAGDWIRGSGG